MSASKAATQEAKHTPGPWWANKSVDQTDVWAELSSGECETVAVVYHGLVNCEANARLIASAPVLGMDEAEVGW